MRRARVVQQVANPVTEILFDRGLARAKELDAYVTRTGKVIGPLHGLPISLKNQVPIKGVEQTMGWVGGLGEFSEKDALIATHLEKQGAILYCKTSMPQASRLFVGPAFNNLYGRTLNPFKTGVQPGGSSTGEGVLIAMRGSIAGFGSDDGGSLRVPAAYNGIFSLKPSRGRTPYAGMENSTPSIKAVMGPMCASIDGLKTLTKALLDAEPWEMDPDCVRMPWSDDAYRLRDHGG